MTSPAGSGCRAAASLAARCSASRWPEFARWLSGNALLEGATLFAAERWLPHGLNAHMHDPFVLQNQTLNLKS